MSFDAQKHMTKLPRRQRVGDGQWKTIEFDYLEVKWRLVWLREDHPDAQIDTEIVQVDDVHCIVRARVTVPGGGMATGLGYSTPDKWKEGYIEKTETKALGRALAALGYGTQFCEDFDDEGQNLADSPIEQRQAPAATEQPRREPAAPAEPVVTPPAVIGAADERAERAFWETLGSDGIDETAVSGLLNGLTPAGYRAKHGLTWSQMIADVRKRHQLAQPVGNGGRR